MVEPCETETVEIARTIAACAVAIADRSNTALACHADYVLIIPGSPNVFRSYAGVTAVAETLVGLVAIRTGVQDNGTESFQMAEWRRLLKLVSKRVRRLVGSQSRLRKYASAAFQSACGLGARRPASDQSRQPRSRIRFVPLKRFSWMTM